MAQLRAQRGDEAGLRDRRQFHRRTDTHPGPTLRGSRVDVADDDAQQLELLEPAQRSGRVLPVQARDRHPCELLAGARSIAQAHVAQPVDALWLGDEQLAGEPARPEHPAEQFRSGWLVSKMAQQEAAVALRLDEVAQDEEAAVRVCAALERLQDRREHRPDRRRPP